jgi:hypothetical protein
VTIYKDRADYSPPPCPQCGGPSRPTWVDLLVNWDTVGSVVTGLDCIARCSAWDPEGYMAAIVDHTVV